MYTSSNKYRLVLDNDHNLEAGDHITLTDHKKGIHKLELEIDSVEPKKLGFKVILKDFKRLFDALSIPLKNRYSRAKLLTISVVYIFLSPSRISSVLA